MRSLNSENNMWILLFFSSILVSSAAILNVGPGQTYTTISAANTASVDGDTIAIHAGTYSGEGSINTKAGVKFIGQSNPFPLLTAGTKFVGNSRNWFEQLRFEDWRTTNVFPTPLYFASSTNIVITNCQMVGNIPGDFPSSAYGIRTISCTDVLIISNYISGAGSAIAIAAADSPNNTYDYGVRMINNIITNNTVDSFNIHGRYLSIIGNLARNNIDTNWAFNHPDGIQFTEAVVGGLTNAHHVVIAGNYFENYTQGLFIEANNQPASDTNYYCSFFYVFNNIFNNSSGVVNGVNMDSIAVKNLGMSGGREGYFFNNYWGRSGGTSLIFDWGMTNGIYFWNNIVDNPIAQGFYTTLTNLFAPGNLNNNIYSNCPVAKINWNGTQYTSIAAFKAAVFGQEVNGFEGNALFTVSQTPSLDVNSPAIGAAQTVANRDGLNFAIDFYNRVRPQGVNWDIGPVEYVSSPPTPIPPSQYVTPAIFFE